MSEAPKGQVVTFYSYKGGTGRTMALANVAWILAASGKRVLVADWDLESPGLHRFFKPFLDVDAIASTGGVIDLIREFEEQVKKDTDKPEGWVREIARVEQYAFSLTWHFPGGGSLDFLSAGRQNDSYAAALGGLDWENFYNRLQGQNFLDALRQDMISHYDYSLIDSRTGFSDVSDICTGHLPDTLVDCFTLSDQGINGAAQVATSVRNHRVRDDSERHIRVLPVAMRVDLGEKGKADAGRALALRSFPGLPAGMGETERIQYFNRVEVPYITYFAYEETLATFAERPGTAISLLGPYVQLAEAITDGRVREFAAMDEGLRAQWARKFERSLEEAPATIVLDYAAEDQAWAEWIASVLVNAGVSVVDHGPVGLTPRQEVRSATSRTLAVVSAKYVDIRQGVPREVQWGEPALLCVYIADISWQSESQARVSVVDHSAQEAAEQVLSLLGELPGSRRHNDHAGSVRFPGIEPEWFLAPARNPRFTGRMEDLHRLRSELRSSGEAVVLPIALQGMGGIGKTQLALEYVHRFRSSYDLIWWIQADPPQFIDTALSDLGTAVGIPAERTAVESALAVLSALRQGRPTHRWLLVFDNADDLARVENFLPQGGRGHLLITSRNAEWGNRANAIPVNVFQRGESVSHLRGRVPSMSREQAEQLAEALADLPIAVAVAGAWLAETGTPVPDYLREIEQDGVGTLRLEAVWGLSLERLRERSPGAYRLLQICSVLAPETALELLYSDQLAAHLIQYDPAVSDRLMRGSLIQQINRLALLKLDVHAGQAQVHRLLQEVVRRRMSSEEIDEARHQAHLVLTNSRPSGEVDDPATWPRFRMLWPHLQISNADGCNDVSVRQLLIDRVRYLWRRGDVVQGEAFGNEIAEKWERRLLESAVDDNWTAEDVAGLSRQLLHLRFNIANILRERGRFEAALKLDEAILREQRVLLGDRHSHTLMTSGSRAADLRALGRYAETLPLEQANYRVWGEEFGEDHSRTLSAANNLAISFRSMGNFRQAELIDTDVWTRRRHVLGEVHPYTLQSAGGVGRDLREAGEYEKSVTLLRNLLTSCRDALGKEATVTLNTQVNLSASLRSAGRADEAGPLLEQAYEAFGSRFDRNSPDALACRLNRAANLLAVGNTEPALREMLKVTAEYIRSLGPDHPFTLVCLSDQSAVYRTKGDHQEAYSLIDRTAARCLEALGPSHPYSMGTAMNLAICEYDAGEAQSALRRTEKLVEVMREALGIAHPDTLCCQVNLEIIASSLERRDFRGLGTGADAVDSPAFNRLARKLGPEHPSVRSLRAGSLVYRVIDPHDPF